ncbi:hypothetical protein NCH01_28340 [Neoasaia chiangmaiensis]|uniref:Uncharacterized protein n=1 Tax=Neoasaia chiangmaiensis TaxID=320497 RepID=A0A1U9KLS7_9PROT|nr:FHA domain-containing protein [Neoasaia chiangmaiensis]AQS86746.1 hypothetical protein A0U93_00895 [Neoasaia chiangmaiensis]GEN16403.1 hypothetical protein NCH01_28340 [Neoasaia chiangmaiensis]
MTSLILSLTCAPGGIPLETRQIDADRYSLGRDPDNDWILFDPTCQVSRHHCRIVREGDDWLFADLSRNGTRHEVGHASGMTCDEVGSHRLASGDRLHLGDYEIAVTVQEEESSFRIMPLPDFIADLRSNFAARPPTSREPGRTRARSETRLSSSARGTEARSPQRGDPLLELLGLEGTDLPLGRRSVVLYRLGASLSAAVHGLRRMARPGRAAEKGEDFRLLDESQPIPKVLRAIAGMDKSVIASPEQIIGQAFDDLHRHQLCLSLAYRRCMKEMLHALDPEEASPSSVREGGQGRRTLSLSFLKRRHRRVSENFDRIVEASFARHYREEWERLDSGRDAAGRD